MSCAIIVRNLKFSGTLRFRMSAIALPHRVWEMVVIKALYQQITCGFWSFPGIFSRRGDGVSSISDTVTWSSAVLSVLGGVGLRGSGVVSAVSVLSGGVGCGVVSGVVSGLEVFSAVPKTLFKPK